MSNEREERLKQAPDRLWVELRTQHAFTVKPKPHIETVAYMPVALFNVQYEGLTRAALLREQAAATAMRDKCVKKVKAALGDARRSWAASRATTEYELGARAAFTYALAAIAETILASLKSYRCQNTRELADPENGSALVDLLTPGSDANVDRGIEELELLADRLWSDVDEALKSLPSVQPVEEQKPGWIDEGEHIWTRRQNVECVECPHCLFTFAAFHTSGDTDGYSCPNCEGCPDAATMADNDGELPIEDLERDHYRDHPPDEELFGG